MIRRVVVDSSSDLACEAGGLLQSVPLKVLIGAREYVDDAALDVQAMLSDMTHSKERTGSSCPNVYEWLQAFEGADEVFAVAISSQMSGSYATASQAAVEYMEKYPAAKVCVIDTKNASAGIRLQVEELLEMCASDKAFDEIEWQFDQFRKHVHLVFGMESISNFVKNGRIPAVIGAAAGILNLRFVNKASDEGKLVQLKKVRGTSRMLDAMFQQVLADGYGGGRVMISHVDNERGAQTIRDKLLEQYPDADVFIYPCRGLCSYYAEPGGILVGFVDNE